MTVLIEPLTPVVAGVVLLVRLVPERAFLGRHVLAEAFQGTSVDSSSEITQSSPTLSASASMAGVQNSTPFQHPRSRLRWLSKSIEVPSRMMPLTVPGASMAMRAAINRPCEVPRTNASEMPSASSTCSAAMPCPRYVNCPYEARVLAVPVGLDGEQVGGGGERSVRGLGPRYSSAEVVNS